MTVQGLIDELQKVEDKSLGVVYMTPDGFIDVGLICLSGTFQVIVISDS